MGLFQSPDMKHITGSNSEKRNIVYVMKYPERCGGARVIMEHASRLRARGHNVWVYHFNGTLEWFPRQVPMRLFKNLAEMIDELHAFRGIKVATWWETAPWVAESLVDGDKGYYLVQDIEESYASNLEELKLTRQTYNLPLTIITEGTWVRDQLKQRFGLDSVFVSIGLDHQQFHPASTHVETHHILTQSRTWSGGGDWLKGWPVAYDTFMRVHRENPRAMLTTFSIETTPKIAPELPHVHFQAPSDQLLIQLYRRAGIYLMTSNHEGFGLTAAEAMACGRPVVATAAQGNEEFCIDGITALVAPAGDVEALTQKCLQLQSDPDLARQIVENARATITTYTWDRVIDRLEQEFLGINGPDIKITPIVSALSSRP